MSNTDKRAENGEILKASLGDVYTRLSVATDLAFELGLDPKVTSDLEQASHRVALAKNNAETMLRQQARRRPTEGAAEKAKRLMETPAEWQAANGGRS